MTLDLPAGKAMPMTFTQRLVGAALLAVVVALAWPLAYVVINGSEMRAMAESQKAEEIAQENRALCAKLGMNFGTPAFATCADVIGQVRRLQEERLNRDAGML